MPEVKNERFCIYGGFVEKNFSYSIEIDEGFYLDIICGPYKETISVPGDKLFDDPPLWGIDEGAVIVDEEFAPLYDYIQDAIQEKKKKCMSLNKSGPLKGQRKDDKYDEMWLYLYDEINPFLFQLKREQVKAMPFNFENYWSKVCLFTSLYIPKWYISLSEEL